MVPTTRLVFWIGRDAATFFALFDGGLAQIQQGGHVEGFLQAVVLGNLAVAPHFRPHFRLVQDGGEVQPFGLPVVDGLLGLQHIGTSHHFVDGAEAELSHPLADFLGDEPHVVDHVVGVAHEVLPQFRVLGRHTHRAGVHVADPHHDAAQGHQGRGGKAVFLSSQQGGDHHVPPGLHLPVGFHHHPTAQVVHHQGLVGFG